MFRFLREVVLYRILGGRVMLALTVGSWLLGKLRGRRSTPSSYPQRRAAREAGYQPSQGESQIVQRDPR